MDEASLRELVDRYLANLGALYRRDPELAARLDALPFASLPALEPTRDGRLTARVTADDGQPVYLHSRYEPSPEAARLLDALPPTDNPAFVLLGLNLGYVVAELERRHDQPIVVAAEADLAILKACLCVHNFSRPIAAGRLTFLTVADKGAVHEKLTRCNADLMLGFQFVGTPLTRRRQAEFHEQVGKLITEFVAYQRMQMVTLMKTDRATFRNVAFNLPHYLRSPGVDRLAGLAVGYPAVIVAAGPSLIRNLRLLPSLRSRAVLIAVQTVFKLLNRLGCRPHFVTSLDFHDVSVEFFRGITDAGDCTLVAEPKAASGVLDGYRGPRVVLHHHFMDRLARGACPKRGSLPPGTTVAHLAFYLAQHLGCDPILFVGQDLAFTDGLFYLPGSPIEDIWRPELGRFQTVEMKQWERVVRNRAILKRMPDFQGRPVYTDELLLTYYEQFTKDFAAAPQKIIQASEGGLVVPGMEPMPLAEAAQLYCTRELPAGLLSVDAPQAPAPLGDVRRELDQRIAEIGEIQRIMRETREALDRLRTLLDRPEEFNRVVAQVDSLRVAIQRYDETYRLVIDVSAQAELRRYGADRRLGAPERETPEIAARRLQRDSEYVDALLESCEFLARVLPQAAERLREECP